MMNKNKFIIIFFIFVLIFSEIGIYYYITQKNSNNSNYNISRVSLENISKNELYDSESNITNENNTNSDNNIDEKSINNNTSHENNSIEITQNSTATTPPPNEEEISSFSTTIYSKDAARQKNIEISCNTLNGTVVKKGSTFSFCGTVGQATTAKGYQKADIFDKNGNKKKGLGGGNCQISTTLYNALLKVPFLIVTERHRHSNKVPYIKNGNDAAVAYGSYDLKFRNDSGNDIKITTAVDKSSITIRLLKLI